VATLTLVRHGQASFLSDDYDRLSPLGADQMRALGRLWASRERSIDRLVTGPLKRQRGSLAALREGLGEHARDPAEDHVEAGLIEYDALSVVARAIPQLAGRDPEIARLAMAATRGAGDPGKAREALFRLITRRWIRGEIAIAEAEPFADFRARVSATLARLRADASPGQGVVAVTSAGVVAAALGHALELGDEQVLELSFIVRNASVTELLVRGDALILLTFNAIPHLADPAMVTFR